MYDPGKRVIPLYPDPTPANANTFVRVMTSIWHVWLFADHHCNIVPHFFCAGREVLISSIMAFCLHACVSVTTIPHCGVSHRRTVRVCLHLVSIPVRIRLRDALKLVLIILPTVIGLNSALLSNARCNWNSHDSWHSVDSVYTALAPLAFRRYYFQPVSTDVPRHVSRYTSDCLQFFTFWLP